MDTKTQPMGERIASGCDAKAAQARDKRWDECGIEEKVERIRQVLRNVEEAQTVTGQIATRAHEVAHDHNHDQHGRVMRVAHDRNSPFAGEAISSFQLRRRPSLLD